MTRMRDFLLNRTAYIDANIDSRIPSGWSSCDPVLPFKITELRISGNAEFLEISNVGAATASLAGAHIRGGLYFNVPAGVNVAAGDRVVVVANNACKFCLFHFFKKMKKYKQKFLFLLFIHIVFSTAYPNATVIGEYSRNLNSVDDEIVLSDAYFYPLSTVTYTIGANGWPVAAGTACDKTSLELIDDSLVK